MDKIKQLREETGCGVMDAKKALEEANGDMKKARELVHERGLQKAAKKADRETKEGYIGSYVHTTGKVAAMVTLLCETDFVARNEEFQEVAREVAMQVASMRPETVEELMEQEYIRDSKKSIQDLVKSLSGKVGENVTVGEFQVLSI
ncbi:translation elongation factor Ts [Candidatus Woesebacteria bacterium]|nr:translation elongation factor Ts [Candidatus Woesebacteria bacterium]MCD8507395.1 translation elongation factor Ts [Candidatus Woesebacteria bacterium]MCD8526990.1 translation elongation factor Ts [Candidatus Woesebacteria bacterium]MCD8546769.1 translation elongation factor Ts [Candidatus Woesebacteria bacterium]